MMIFSSNLMALGRAGRGMIVTKIAQYRHMLKLSKTLVDA